MLAGIEALGVRIDLPDPVRPAALALVFTLALALPPLFTGWSSGHLSTFDQVVAGALGGAIGWLVLVSLWRKAPPAVIVPVAAGAAGLVVGTLRIIHR